MARPRLAPSPRRSRPRARASVRVRITAAALVVVGAAVAVGAWGLLAVLRSAFLDTIDEHAVQRAQEVRTMLEDGPLDPRLPVPVRADEDDLLVQVVDRDGEVVAASPNALDQPPLGPGAPHTGGRWFGTVRGLAIDPDDKFRLLAYETESRAGPVAIYVATELKQYDDIVDTVAGTVRTGSVAVLVFMAVLTWFLVGRALRPVEAIRAQVAEISAAALDRRVPEPVVKDEVGRLAGTMNAMLERLQSANERQQRFAADASHELRSPLASVRAQLEVAAAHPESTTVERLAADVLEETDRMERLVADLLLLTRTEKGRSTSPPRPVDVDEIVLSEVARLRRRAGVQVDLSGLSGGRTRGHGEDLRRVVRNLLENAARHASATVRVALRSDGEAVELAVADDGPGIAPPDRQRIFDRFTRLDDARSGDDGGSGLGLAIAREVVAAHEGRIWVEDGPGGAGARFVVRLPAAR